MAVLVGDRTARNPVTVGEEVAGLARLGVIPFDPVQAVQVLGDVWDHVVHLRLWLW